MTLIGAASAGQPGRTRPIRIAGLVVSGAVVVAIFFGGLGGWAALAPLASAAIAPGTVTVDSNRKTVQHLEGGIIAELLVRNGDRVRKGQVLLRLDDVESRAAFDLLRGQRLALLAHAARSIAERDGLDDLAPISDLAVAGDEQAAAFLAGQRSILASRTRLLNGQIAVQEQRIAQSEAEIASLQAQLASGELQLAFIADELKGVGELYSKGLEKKARLLALKREAARLSGLQGEYRGRITRAEQGAAEARLQILSLKEEREAEAVADLRDVQVELAELTERLRMAESRLERTDIAAPKDGLVLNLRYFTTGGVVEPAAPILDIVPVDEALVVEAQLDPSNIDEVYAGLSAEVRLTAYRQRITPSIIGKVAQVSADVLTDQHSGRSYYTARIEIPRSSLARVEGVELFPGMPVEVMIATGERTALDYFMSPVFDSFRHAFREQ